MIYNNKILKFSFNLLVSNRNKSMIDKEKDVKKLNEVI